MKSINQDVFIVLNESFGTKHHFTECLGIYSSFEKAQEDVKDWVNYLISTSSFYDYKVYCNEEILDKWDTKTGCLLLDSVEGYYELFKIEKHSIL